MPTEALPVTGKEASSDESRKARRRVYDAKRREKPEYKARRRVYDAKRREKPEYKARHREEQRKYREKMSSSDKAEEFKKKAIEASEAWRAAHQAASSESATRHYQLWTDAEIRLLREPLLNYEIAVRTGRTLAAVTCARRRYGIPNSHPSATSERMN